MMIITTMKVPSTETKDSSSPFRLPVFLLFLLTQLLISGCETGDNREPKAAVTTPEGIIQSRVDENGVTHIALGMAPKTPGGKAPDLTALRGIDLLDRSVIPSANSSENDQIRKRAPSTRRSVNPGTFHLDSAVRFLSDIDFVATLGLSEFALGYVKNPTGGTFGGSIAYASSRYAAFEHYIDFDQVPGDIQKITFRHGPYEGTAEIFKEGTSLWARVNGGQQKFIKNYLTDFRFVNVSIILPLYGSLFPKGLGAEALDDLVGTWRLEAQPQFSDKGPGIRGDYLYQHENPEGVGSTPFDFILKSLVVDNIEAAYNADIIEPNTGDSLSGGATFTARARFIAGQDDDAPDTTPRLIETRWHGRLVYRAQIFTDGGGVVRAMDFQETDIPGPSGTPITIDWDGKDNSGNHVPGDAVYGVSIMAMLDRNAGNEPPNWARGFIFTITPGIGPEGVSPAFDGTEGLQLTPNPYIPYTDEEINGYLIDENDNPYWPDTNGDGTPNFPDHNGDGEEDFQAGDGPPPLEIYASLDKLGYTTNWTLRVFKEHDDGFREEITEGDLNELDGPPPWTGEGTVNLRWNVPGDLGEDVTGLTFELDTERCRRTTVGVQILGRNTGENEQCVSRPMEATLALRDITPVELVLRNPDGDVIAKSGSRRTNQRIGLDKIALEVDSVTVEAHKLPEDVDTLQLSVRSRPSLKTAKTITLNRLGDSDFLQGSFNPQELFKDNGQEQDPTFSSLDWSTGLKPQGDTLTFLLLLLSRDGVASGRTFFQANSRAISTLFADIDAQNQFGLSTNDQIDLNTVGRDAFEAGGYETLQVEVDDPDINSNNRVLARFANGPNVLMLSGHGSYESLTGTGFGNVKLASRTGPRPADAFKSGYWKGVKTLIVAGCVACNLNDYALNSKAHLSESDVGKDFFEKIPPSSPAKTLKEIIHPQGIILGYQAGAPEAPADVPPIHGFFQDMGPTWISQDTTTPLLWMRAHAKVDFLDNASAMDNQAFYFISFREVIDPPRVTLRGMRQTIHHKKRQMRKIHKSQWTNLNVVNTITLI